MSARRNKKVKKLILPFTFILGVLAFPLGNMAFEQAKKTAKALLADEAPKKPKDRQGPAVVKKHPKKSARVAAKPSKQKNKKLAKQQKRTKQQKRYAH
jgi:hypothetical protein